MRAQTLLVLLALALAALPRACLARHTYAEIRTDRRSLILVARVRAAPLGRSRTVWGPTHCCRPLAGALPRSRRAPGCPAAPPAGVRPPPLNAPLPPPAPPSPRTQPFGFGEDGRMNISVSNFKLWKAGSAKGAGFHK